MKLTDRNLRACLDSATADLRIGEKVRVDLTEDLHSKYVDLQLAGYYPEILCTRNNGDYYLVRVR